MAVERLLGQDNGAARAGLMWAGDVVAQYSANRPWADWRGRLAAQLSARGP